VSRLNVVILAAGLGKRMHSTLPKVLHPLAGKPLISHVLTTARTLLPGKICVVYGHGGELVPQVINDDGLIWVKQDPQMGTGHALLQTLPHLDSNGATLVLYGDVPLTSVETLKKLIATSAESVLALLTLELDDPSGYGRIVRNSEGNGVIAIVEEKDASKSELQICSSVIGSQNSKTRTRRRSITSPIS
jgi:bifunctional UDP-N-acetylglucosamine pyrophosphorylase/glucosamine-1-phosphate N-acetyltransferase